MPHDTNDTPRLDPRFDPLFQRGYDESAGTSRDGAEHANRSVAAEEPTLARPSAQVEASEVAGAPVESEAADAPAESEVVSDGWVD